MPTQNSIRSYRPCPSCGKLKTFAAELCATCRREITKPTHYFCVDCGKRVSYRSPRCRHCASKERFKELTQHGAERKRSRLRERRQAGLLKVPCPLCGSPMNKTSKTCAKCMPHPRVNWKGGRIKQSGYIKIWQPQHPGADKIGYVREHLLVWEQANGKPLPKGWHIHHLNGIKSDNRPRNLVGLPSKKHYLVLQAKAKRILELEGLLNH